MCSVITVDTVQLLVTRLTTDQHVFILLHMFHTGETCNHQLSSFSDRKCPDVCRSDVTAEPGRSTGGVSVCSF